MAIVDRHRPVKPGLRASMEWLQNNSHNYIGKWVALNGGQLVGASEDRNTLIAEIGNAEGLLVTLIPPALPTQEAE